MTPLIQRLLEQAARREQIIALLSPAIPDAIDMARQDVADIREAVARLEERVLN